MKAISKALAEYIGHLPSNRSERILQLNRFIVAEYPRVKFSFKYKMPSGPCGKFGNKGAQPKRSDQGEEAQE